MGKQARYSIVAIAACSLVFLLILGFCDSFTPLRLTCSPVRVGNTSCHHRILADARQVECKIRCRNNDSIFLSRLMSAKSNSDSVDANNRAQIAIDKFITTLQASLDDGSFVSFTLTGPVAPKREKLRSSREFDCTTIYDDVEKLRGKFKRISGRLILLQNKNKTSVRKMKGQEIDENNVEQRKLYLQTTIKYHMATDIVKNWKVDKQLNSNHREVEEGLRQLFSTAMGVGTNSLLSEWGALNICNDIGILGGIIETIDSDYKLTLYPAQDASLKQFPKRKKTPQTKRNLEGSLSHDTLKNFSLSPSSNFFVKLGISNADGKPLVGMASKLRQCQKFVEIVGNLIDNVTTVDRIRVIDMGCGRGYLTFALHSYLTSKFSHMQRNIKVDTQGIDRRPKLINEVNGIARELGGEFTTLNFICGSIESAPDNLFENDCDSESTLDILIALHACDTATDDALWFAITRDVDLIITAPCCQHELRSQIDRHVVTNSDQPLANVLRHAIYRERATETVTDSMRAILLEIAGYQSNVFEFIGGEHTAKNVMITATKMTSPRHKNKECLRIRRKNLVDLADLYGIRHHRLATLMDEDLTIGEASTVKKSEYDKRIGMAPL